MGQPLPREVALDSSELKTALEQAERLAQVEGIRGKALTPFLLRKLAELTAGKTLQANQALVVANATLAARIALELGACDRR